MPENTRVGRVEPEGQRGDDAEAAAAAAQRPEQVGVLVGRRVHELAVGGDHLGGDHAVGGEAVGARQPGGAAAQRVAGDADGAAAAGQRAEAVGRGGPLTWCQVAPGPTVAVRRRGSTRRRPSPRAAAAGAPSAAVQVPWPVDCTASGRSWRRAVRTTTWTSVRSRATAMTAGADSTVRFQPSAGVVVPRVAGEQDLAGRQRRRAAAASSARAVVRRGRWRRVVGGGHGASEPGRRPAPGCRRDVVGLWSSECRRAAGLRWSVIGVLGGLRVLDGAPARPGAGAAGPGAQGAGGADPAGAARAGGAAGRRAGPGAVGRARRPRRPRRCVRTCRGSGRRCARPGGPMPWSPWAATAYRLVADTDVQLVQRLRQRRGGWPAADPDAAAELLAEARDAWRGDPELPATAGRPGAADRLGARAPPAGRRAPRGRGPRRPSRGGARRARAGHRGRPAGRAGLGRLRRRAAPVAAAGRGARRRARARRALAEVGLDPGPALVGRAGGRAGGRRRPARRAAR